MSGQTGLEKGPGGGTGPASILAIENLEEEAISTQLCLPRFGNCQDVWYPVLYKNKTLASISLRTLARVLFLCTCIILILPPGLTKLSKENNPKQSRQEGDSLLRRQSLCGRISKTQQCKKVLN